MRAVIQRVSQAAVSVDQQEIGKIGCGLDTNRQMDCRHFIFIRPSFDAVEIFRQRIDCLKYIIQ